MSKKSVRKLPLARTRLSTSGVRKPPASSSGVREKAPIPIEAGLFHELFTSSSDAMMLASVDGDIVHANPSCRRMFGLRKRALPLPKVEDYIFEGDLRTFRSKLRDARMTKHEPAWFSLRRLTSKGNIIQCRERITIIRDGRGRFVHSFHQIQDITKERESEVTLREREERARLLFDASADPMWILDSSSHRFLVVNDAAVRNYGYSRKKFLTMTLEDLHPLSHRDIARLPDEGDSPDIQIHKTRAGKVIQVETTSYRTVFEGKPAEIAVARDITARVHATQAMRMGEMRYRALIEKSSDVVAVIGEDGLLSYSSPVGEQLLGYKVEDVLGTDPFLLLHPDDVQRARDLLRKLLYSPEDNVSARLRIRHINGTWRWIELDATNHIDNPAIKGIIINYRDITERRELEERLQLSDQILRKVGSIVLVSDATGSLVHVSNSTERILGYKPEELLGDGWWKIRRPDKAESAQQRANIVGILNGTVPLSDAPYSRMIYHKSGEPRWILWQDSRSPEGLLIGVGQDITQRRRTEEALRLSEERLKMVFENSEDMIMVQDLEGRYLYYNEKQRYGIRSEELLSKTPYDLHDEATADAIMRRIGEVAQTGRSVITESRMTWQDEQLWFSDCSYPIRDAAGKVVSVATISRDITGSRRAERELHTLRKAVESSNEIIFMTDRSGTFTFVNPAFSETYGYSPEEVIGKTTPRILKSGSQGESFYFQFWSTILEKKVTKSEFVNRAKDGGLHMIEASVNPVLDDHGNIMGFLAIQRDITDEHNYKQKIREQAALLDVAQDAIIVMDMHDRITYWNKGAERVFGWSEKEAEGNLWNELLYRGSPSLRRLAESTVLESGEWSGELPHARKDGSEIIVESRWSLIRTRTGSPVSKLVVNTDITAKKRLERQFLRSQRMESVGTLAGGIAHDLNNVLAPILMAVALLRKKLPAEPDQRLLDGLETTVKRGASLVKQVLSFSRGTEIDRAILQVRHLIDEIKKFATETFPASIEILSIVPRDLWTITGDATQIHQIILNLCVNARDAMPSGGKLTIEAKNFLADENFARVNVEAKPGPYVLISVTDTGIGIPPEIRDKIFEPFFTTKEVGKGTGLGLSTVYGIVQNHKGLIHVYSEVERGTRFHIYLPATHDEARKETPLQPQAQHHGSDELVLVVDDERAVCEVARLTLENNGYRVVTAADGAEALSIYLQKQKDITVVITDVNMPIMDGSALIRAIRRLDPGIRIVVSTGLSDSAKVAEIPRSEVQGILHKPFTAEGLLTLMDEVLHSGPSRER